MGRNAGIDAANDVLDELDGDVGAPPSVQLIMQGGSRNGRVVATGNELLVQRGIEAAQGIEQATKDHCRLEGTPAEGVGAALQTRLDDGIQGARPRMVIVQDEPTVNGVSHAG